MENNSVINTIISNLLFNEEYYRKVSVFIKPEYFDKEVNKIEKEVFLHIRSYFNKYDSLPSKSSLSIEVKNNGKLSKEYRSDIIRCISGIEQTQSNFQWLIDITEKWAQNRALTNALIESIEIIHGNDKELQTPKIPGKLQSALSVSFSNNVGHDYIEGIEDRLDYYKRKDKKVEFDLERFNEVTKGGLSVKTLNVIVAGTGVGKSLFMCHYASSCLKLGHNVLYITCEMSEESIAERIDSNFLDISINDLRTIEDEKVKESFQNKIDSVKGQIMIKEYPTSTASVSNFENLIRELEIKKKFVPDVVLIDYINICSSARFSAGSGANSYTYIKAIAEELRGLACKHGFPVLTATQVNRQGFGKDDLSLSDVSESFGLPATADFMFALISNDELNDKNQLLVKQLKNRYNDISKSKQFFLTIDRSKMKLYDCDRFISNIDNEEIEDDMNRAKIEAALNTSARFKF